MNDINLAERKKKRQNLKNIESAINTASVHLFTNIP
jgi:hypothetical protein